MGDERTAPERQPGERTPAFLARVLAVEGAPRHMVSLAEEGHYDDFLSPLPMPEMQLHADAREAGLPQIAAWVELGVFDATKAESSGSWCRGRGTGRSAALTRSVAGGGHDPATGHG